MFEFHNKTNIILISVLFSEFESSRTIVKVFQEKSHFKPLYRAFLRLFPRDESGIFLNLLR